MEEIYRRLKKVFLIVFDDDSLQLSPGLTADDVPEWDSLSHIRLILAVQKEFAVKFSSSQTASLKNVGDLATLVRSKIAA